MLNTNYWYYGQIKQIILHTLRIFQNFCVSEGIDENNKPILRRVPCVYASTDKSVVYMLNKATDTIIETCPKMVLSISSVSLNERLQSGAPYYEYQTSVTEKKFNEETGNYEYEPGNSYNITRLNPLPLGIKFKLYVLTTMQDQKFQLFEQIRSIFSPTLELQTSENPLDWSRITAITLTGLNWSSKGTSNLDTTLDAMDMDFEVNTNLDLPSLVQKEAMVEQIVHSIGDGNSIEDIMSWSLEDVSRTFYSPTNNRITAYLDDDGSQKLRLEPSDKATNWFQLLAIHDIKYNPAENNINVNCLTTSNVDKRNDIIGTLKVRSDTPNIADWIINEDTLPQTNVPAISEIVEPHDFTPEFTEGIRYLILEDISNCKLWGDFYHDDGTKLSNNEVVNKNSIIEYENGKWVIKLNPDKVEGIYYIRDNSNPLRIYTYNNEYKAWVDVVNKSYPVGFWRLSQKN